LNSERHSLDGAGQFHTTRWSAVLLSAQSQAPGSQAALAELCRIYWYPIYSFIHRRGSSPEDAQDLTQGFAEERCRVAPLDFLTADKVFDARWAMTVMDEAMVRLRQEYAGQGKTSLFESLKPFIDPINSKAALSYEQAADTLRVRVELVKKLIFRLRKRYASILREEVARTVSGPAEINEEIHALCEALIATEGRLDP
jgi:hypothetical protein